MSQWKGSLAKVQLVRYCGKPGRKRRVSEVARNVRGYSGFKGGTKYAEGGEAAEGMLRRFVLQVLEDGG